MPISISSFSTENRGRVLLLFLLFLLALYEFVTAGFSTFAIACMLPIVVLYIYAAFTWRMFTFWTLIFVNYFIQLKDIHLPIPMSLADEMLELILLAVALIDVRQDNRFSRANNTMLFAIMLWVGFCLIEVFNNSCDLGINVSLWFTGFRLLALQLVWILLVFSFYISSPKILMTYLKVCEPEVFDNISSFKYSLQDLINTFETMASDELIQEDKKRYGYFLKAVCQLVFCYAESIGNKYRRGDGKYETIYDEQSSDHHANITFNKFDKESGFRMMKFYEERRPDLVCEVEHFTKKLALTEPFQVGVVV